MNTTKKVFLSDAEMPRQWYNLAADLSTQPSLGPDGQPITPEMLAAVFPMNIIDQEMSRERWIDIPEGILEMLARWRPTPLVRATALEAAIDTPAKIYYKNESVSPVGSHKPNSAVAQAWYNKQFGIKRITTETGAGQWGCALSFACALLDIECKVFMVRVSFEQKPLRKMMMETWGATCVPSPSSETVAGRKVLEEDPTTPGSLGIAISEAIEQAVSDPKGETRYALGSVLNHVMLHQTIIGLETKKQLKKFGEGQPDVIVGCAGGGSNFAGLAFPFIHDVINGDTIKVVAAEPSSCPTLTKAPFTYDHGDIAKMTPLMPMHSLGHAFIPAPIHSGGLRYHGMAPLVSAAVQAGFIDAVALQQTECFAAGLLFARTEGIIPAPESNHAIAATIREAKLAKEEGKEKVIVFNLSGHGMMDLSGYEKYLTGTLEDYELPMEVIERYQSAIKHHPQPA